jgi:MFS family permease
VASVAGRGHRGWLLIAGSVVFGGLLAAFGLSSSYAFSVSALALAGFFNSLYMTTVVTLLQTLVPDALRGRVMGIYSLTWSLMPLGGFQAGLIADSFGPPLAVALGGFGILGFGIVIAAIGKPIRQLK